ncbi:MAG: ribosomal protein S18-alanine N-acetyltransferase [Eubacteriales bacterium]
MSWVRLVPAAENLMDEISAIEHAAFTDPWSDASIRFCIGNPVFAFTVALDENGRVAGYLIGSLLPPEGEICSLAVRFDLRRQGIGACLLSDFLRKGEQLACDRFFLEVRSSNRAAIGLYRSHGFEAFSTRKNYYSRPVEDAVLMQWQKKTNENL